MSESTREAALSDAALEQVAAGLSKNKGSANTTATPATPPARELSNLRSGYPGGTGSCGSRCGSRCGSSN